MNVTIGSGNAGVNNRRPSDDTLMSEETFDHDPALDKDYGVPRDDGISRVKTSIEIFERAAEGNWPLPGPSRVKDNGTY
jgi:hypothetical protein